MSSVMPALSCFVPASPADSGPSPQPTPAELFHSLPRSRRSAGRDPIKRQMQRAVAALFGEGDQEHGTGPRPRAPRGARRPGPIRERHPDRRGVTATRT